MRQAIFRHDIKQATYEEYRQQHLLRLLRIILPGFLALAIVVLVGAAGAAFFMAGDLATERSCMMLSVISALVIILLLVARRSLRRSRIKSAAVLVVFAGILGTTSAVSCWFVTHHLDATSFLNLIPLLAAILLVGLLDNVRNLILTTTLLNAVTLAILLFTPRSPAVDANLPLIAAGLLMLQWLFAALMLAVQRGVHDLLSEVVTAYERSRQLDSLKDAFISSVNHEIRTPLTSMVMYIDTLKRQHRQMAQEQLQFGLERASDIGQSLTDLVKTILSTRQVEQEVADLSLEALPFLRLINQVLPMLDVQGDAPSAVSGKQAAQRDLRLRVAPVVVVWADRVKLQQVLLNILTNALKYSEPGTPIEIRASYVMLDIPETTHTARRQRAPREMVEITIRDYGHGIAPDQIPLLFQKFVRLPEDIASKVMGNGLGLYLSRLLIDAMGGSIWVESEGVGHGSTFFVRLPVPPPHFDALRNATVDQQ
ncbi:MAG: HAMP domain-containing sensor histidine kinase [Ktedonobacterales bacterium]